MAENHSNDQSPMREGVFRRWIAALRPPAFEGPISELFEFRRYGWIPGWVQVVMVTCLFVLTVLLTHAEYVAKGTCFGFPGPAFNMLFNPMYEEFIFRGWILGALARRHSNRFAIVGSSLLFGLVHIRNIYWLEPTRLIGVMIFTGLIAGPIFAYVTLRFRSVWPAVILHYLNNLSYYLRF
jgi:membrane protease YdiL (CAAX protease family)